MDNIGKTDRVNDGKNVEQLKLSTITVLSIKCYSYFGNEFGGFLFS